MALARLQFWRRKAWATSDRSQQLGLFCVLWLGIIFVFFSAAATKLAGYILPLVPAGAILITLLVGELWTKPRNPDRLGNWPFLVTFGGNSLLLTLMAIAAYISPRLVDGDPATPEFANLLQTSGLPLLFSVILGAMAILAWVILLNANWHKAWWLPNIFAYLLTLLLVISPLSLILDSQIQEPSRTVAQAIKTAIQPGETIFVMGYPRYSVVYYGQNSAIYVDNQDYARELVVKDSSIGETILLVGENRILEQFNLQKGEYESLATAFPYHLWRVSKEKLLPQQ
jgi:4-amino-4-deoxy-L-arabinose transferase-like glycosyltransferase